MRKKQLSFTVFIIFLLVYLLQLVGNTSQSVKVIPSPSPTFSLTASPSATGVSSQTVVTKVVDGDTITVQIAGRKETIRLIGIDTPETVDPRKPLECFGKEASAKMKELVLQKTITLVADPSQSDRDKYTRLLRYVFLEDGTFINEVMIAEGYAYEYTYDEPYQYQKKFQDAQNSAEKNKKGLWESGKCEK